MNLDRWNMLARVMRAPEDGTGAAATTPPAATTTSDASTSSSAAPAAAEAAAPASSAAPAAPAATESPAAAAATDAPAAKESTPSLLGAAEAKLPAKDAPSDQGSEAGKKPAETAKPATDAPKPDAAKPDAAKDPAKDPAAAKDGAEGKKDAAAPADEALAQKPQARTYDAFKVPDGLKLDDKQIGDFTGVLENAELSHQERAQKLVDMYVGEVDRIVKEQRTNQLNAWSDFTDKLKADFKNDPELGGNRQETSLGQARYVIEQLGGTPAQVADMIGMLDHTGMGNHVGLTRLLNTVYERYLAEAKPVPGSAPTRAARGNFQDVMYGGSANGSGG